MATIAKVNRMIIIRQQSMWAGIMMLSVIKVTLVIGIAVIMSTVISSSFYGIPQISDKIQGLSFVLLIALGLSLALVGLLTNVKRQSRIKVGVINRAEFYGVMVALIGWMFVINNRIDQIMLILMQR